MQRIKTSQIVDRIGKKSLESIITALVTILIREDIIANENEFIEIVDSIELAEKLIKEE